MKVPSNKYEKFFVELMVFSKKKVNIGGYSFYRGALLALVFLCGLFYISFSLSKNSYVVIRESLSSKESRSLAEKLKNKGIAFKLLDGGRTLAVPAERVKDSVMQLAVSGVQIPAEESKFFPSLGLAFSREKKTLTYNKTIQNELSNIINTLAVIKKSHVLLNAPEKRGFSSLKKERRATVILSLKENMSMTQEELLGIKKLVSNYIDNLSEQKVFVFDENGRILTESNLLKHQNQVFNKWMRAQEHMFKEKIEALLWPLYGTQNVVVEVTMVPVRKKYAQVAFSSFYDQGSNAFLRAPTNLKKEQSFLPPSLGYKVAVLLNKASFKEWDSPFLLDVQTKVLRLIKEGVSFKEGRDTLVLELANFANANPLKQFLLGIFSRINKWILSLVGLLSLFFVFLLFVGSGKSIYKKRALCKKKEKVEKDSVQESFQF